MLRRTVQSAVDVFMTTPSLVDQFYERIWNAGELSAVSELLSETFSFRGSLGIELEGRDAFARYVTMIRTALADYRCEILDCVSEEDRAFAKMEFSGLHVAPFRGFEPTGKILRWLGAALFHFENRVIADLWVLGDLAGLDVVLKRNQQGGP
jgi:steroid delta-isomerase-like uncharacterized protein